MTAFLIDDVPRVRPAPTSPHHFPCPTSRKRCPVAYDRQGDPRLADGRHGLGIPSRPMTWRGPAAPSLAWICPAIPAGRR
jgi:hypothetical protein